MRRSLLLLPLFALVGCASESANQYPAQYAYPAQPSACQPVSPCSPYARPYQYSNYVPPGPPVQQANFQGPPAPPPTQEPPR
jgi:hypothetical protein